MKRIPITVSNEAESFVLGMLGKKMNRGVVVDQFGRPAITRDGEDVELKKLAIIRKGSEIYVNNDIVSLVKYAADLI